jgi:hypothetical protein
MQEATNEDEMEVSLLPHLHRLLSVLGDLVANTLLAHKHRQNRLINRVVCREEGKNQNVEDAEK